VHNKGFIIDGGTVVVSSQNFSPAGIYENRDAGLILESEQIAEYFGPIFDADWGDSRPLVVQGWSSKGGARKKRKPAVRKAKKASPGRRR
jgi:phosphatidylserine/phosphatidylglycerophosphate/cardiolipin synthase-like enzyme